MQELLKNNNTPMTHILSVKVGNQGNQETYNAIRNKIFVALHNKPIVVTVDGNTFSLTWTAVTTKSETSEYYYTDAQYTNDRATAMHIKKVFTDLTNKLRNEIEGSWKVVYFISRRLTYGNEGPEIIEEFVSGAEASDIPVYDINE